MEERVWLNKYPDGVPHEIDVQGYGSLVHLIEDMLKKFANKPAYYCMGKTLTFKDIDDRSIAFAAYLQGLGLKQGDRIALMMPNILQYPVALFGALRAGLIIVNTNPLYTAREMEHQFNDAEVKAVVIAENFAAEYQKIASKTPIKHVIITSIGAMFGGIQGAITNFVIRKVKKLVPKFSLPNAVKLEKAIKQGQGKSVKKYETGLDDMICIQYTGGTTGVAKGAMLTNSNLLHNLFQVRAWIAASDLKEGQERNAYTASNVPCILIYSELSLYG